MDIQTSATMKSRGRQDWATPHALAQRFVRSLGLTCDVAASRVNAVCADYYTTEEDGLISSWPAAVWCNPPYGRAELPAWTARAVHETTEGACRRAVLLLPYRPATRWWRGNVDGRAAVVWVLDHRVRFVGATIDAPFPSAVAVYLRGFHGRTVYAPLAVTAEEAGR